jgi:hypothetical protein
MTTPATQMTPNSTPPGPPAGDPGLSPSATPPAGVAQDLPPGTATPPAATTPETPPAGSDRVVPAADAYVLPPGTPADLGKWANENQLTQAQLDSALKQYGSSFEAAKTAEMTNLQAMGEAHLESWGEHRAENLQLAKSALLQMDPNAKLTTLLKETGYANHPVILDFLFDLGKNLREGGFLKSPSTLPKGGKAVTAAQAMYGNTHPSKPEV